MTREDAIVILKDIQDSLEETRFLERCAIDMAIKALKEQRPHGKWEYLKEHIKELHEKWEYLKAHITEMRDADGEADQKQTCQFILNLMNVIEKGGDGE